jgi:membrane fusion protein (multidrug efflux system)
MFPRTIMKNLKYRSFLTLTVFALSTCLFGACQSNKKSKEEQQQQENQQAAVETPAVVLIPVQKGKLSSTITVPGELLPYQQVELYAKVNSYVKGLMVDIGSQVHEGQLLATLEAPEINSQLSTANSRIKQQQAVYFASKATYDRLFNTSKTPGTISQNDLEQAEAKKNSDYANLEAVRSAYKEAAANLAYLNIRAPFDGVITTRNVNLGAYVGPGGKGTDPLFVLQDQQRLRLVVSVPESYTGDLSKKNEVTFTVKSLPNQKFTAKIKRLAGALDEKLRSERLEIDVYNTSKRLLPHMFAEVAISLPAKDSTFIVPKTAVVTSTEKVFVIKVLNHRALWVNVQKGFQSGDMVEVYGDLKLGDQIVKQASDEIRDGSWVKDK